MTNVVRLKRHPKYHSFWAVRDGRVVQKEGEKFYFVHLMRRLGKEYLYFTNRETGKATKVSRFILECFEGENSELHALHKNGKSRDNRIENLYWGTAKENRMDACLHGTAAQKLTASKVLAARMLYRGGRYLQRELAEKYGVKRESMRDAINGKNWGWL